MSGEYLQDGGILRPFFKHLRRRLNKIILQVAGGPLRVSLHDSVDKMSKLVEQRNDVLALHQSGLASGAREITYQDIFGKSKAFFPSGKIKGGIVLELVLPREHVEINPAN